MDLQIFEREDFGKVRTMVINDEPWFVAKDVAIALGYSNYNEAVRTHCDGVVKSAPIQDSLGRTQNAGIIPEKGGWNQR